jgi:hypothetical protein
MTQPSKATVSIATRTSNKTNEVQVTFEELKDLVTTQSYSLSTFHENRRRIETFKEMTILGLDIDNFDKKNPDKPKMMLHEALIAFADYKCIIAPSKSHQKEKHGVITDRYRVILFLSSPITDVATFAATWNDLFKKFPAIDDQCKDVSRYWDKSLTIAYANEHGVLVDPVKPSEEEVKPTVAIDAATVQTIAGKRRGRVPSDVAELVVTGVKPGSRDTTFYKAAKSLQRANWEFHEALEFLRCVPIEGADFTEADLFRVVESAFKTEPLGGYQVDLNAGFMDAVTTGLVFVNLIDPSESYIINTEKRLIEPVSTGAIRFKMGEKTWTKYKKERALVGKCQYNPIATGVFSIEKETGIEVLNTYRPPKWKSEAHFSNEPVEVATAPPEAFKTFLSHLVNNDKASYDYVIKWLANALQTARSETILTLIGKPGIGKGVFGGICERLFGASNSVKTRDEVLKSKFNGQLAGKQFVHIDEVAISSTEHYNRLKDLTNPKMEIERKGVDAAYLDNFASFYLTSNDLNAIYVPDDDRRFSIVELTDRKLNTTLLIRSIPELYKEGAIKNLAQYLLGVEVNVEEMLTPFRSARFKLIKEASLKDWEDYLINEWTTENVGKVILLRDLKDHLKDALNMRAAPGRTKVEELIAKYPEFLKSVRVGRGGPRGIQVLAAPAIDEGAEVVELTPAFAPKKHYIETKGSVQ